MKKNKQLIKMEIPSKIKNLINALREVGYHITVNNHAGGDCIDGNIHGYGISITIHDIRKDNGYAYELLFTQEGQFIDNYLELPIIKR